MAETEPRSCDELKVTPLGEFFCERYQTLLPTFKNGDQVVPGKTWRCSSYWKGETSENCQVEDPPKPARYPW